MTIWELVQEQQVEDARLEASWIYPCGGWCDDAVHFATELEKDEELSGSWRRPAQSFYSILFRPQIHT